ncbi:MAG TPA: glycosyltransferase [Hyphomonas sp.]|nr:glycosyltransferase [Hyphomonas sp.]
MPAPVSIIIPTSEAASELPACLESLLPGLEAGLIREVIVADGGSADATRAIAGATGAVLVDCERGRAKQLRAGAAAARGEWLLFLYPSVVLSREWPERVGAHIDERPGMAAAFRFRLRSDTREARWVEARMNRRARWFGLPVGAQGLLAPRALYDALGGYPDTDGLEDLKLARAIGAKRIVLLDAEARSSAARYVDGGWRRTAWRDAGQFVRFMMGGKV